MLSVNQTKIIKVIGKCRIIELYANAIPTGSQTFCYGDIYGTKAEVAAAHPDNEILTGYGIIDETGYSPENASDWYNTSREAERWIFDFDFKMPELLFRGLHIRTGEKVNLKGEPVPGVWVYGGVFQGKGERSIIYSYDPIQKYPVYSETVGQYTGETDKNDTKIFDGDVIRYNRYDVGTEKWYVGTMLVKYTILDLHELHLKMHDYFVKNIEVIGNIHDNPELLNDLSEKIT